MAGRSSKNRLFLELDDAPQGGERQPRIHGRFRKLEITEEDIPTRDDKVSESKDNSGAETGEDLEKDLEERVEREQPARRIIAEPIEFHNIVLYDARSKPYREYQRVILAADAEKDDDGDYLTKTQDGWVAYWKARGKQMLDFPLFYAIAERMLDLEHPAKTNLLRNLRENWLSLATRFDYENDKVIHNYGFSPAEFSCPIPLKSGYLDELKKQREWRSALQTILMPQDLDTAIENLQRFAGVRPYIWTSDKGSRKDCPERAAFVITGSVGLNLVCHFHPGYTDRSSWVVLEE